MSYGQKKGLIEKLEHSVLVDILSIGVYGYFGYVAYTNLGFGDSIFELPPGDLNVAAVQLAMVLIILNVAMLIHDKSKGSKGLH